MRGSAGPAAAAATARRYDPAPAAASRRRLPVALRAAWAVAMFTFFWFTWQGIERQITWYLAVDQFGYLTFAHDLLDGRVFHEWKPMEALRMNIPRRTDILAQTYVRDGDVLYCRYAPGFPIVLAAWLALFGDDGAHYLNPTIYLVLLGVVLAFQWRAFRSPWRAAAGTALLALFPTNMHLWGLTLTRDLAHHLAALTGLFLLLPGRGRRLDARRTALAGLALGFAICIRPDGVLYAAAGVAMALVRWGVEHTAWRRAVAGVSTGALGLLVGAAPFFAYNWAATGNPLLPTQGMELSLLPPAKPAPAPAATPATPAAPAEAEPKVGYPSPGWRGGTHVAVQGGGLKLANLWTTLPGNWRILVRSYSAPLLAVAGAGVVVAIVLRPVFATGALVYCLLAFLFYSCWPRPDGRYLVGVFTFLPMLVVEGVFGTLDVARLLMRLRVRLGGQPAGRVLAGGAALALAVAALSATAQPAGNPVRAILPLVTGIGAAAALLTAAMPRRRLVGWAAIAMVAGLVLLKVERVQAEAARRAPFQRPAMVEARANMQRLLEPGSVVITSEDVGRPAENIEYYSGVADALYLTDLQRWQVSVPATAGWLVAAGQRPYLFLAANQPDLPAILQAARTNGFEIQQVADVPANRSMAHFVAAPFHRGLRMHLYRLSHPYLESVRAAVLAGKPVPLPPAPPSPSP